MNYYRWPQKFSEQFGELVEALRIEGAGFRYMVGRASVDEQKACIHQVESTWARGDKVISNYFIDKAHLFQTNPLPQMLAEGRKFGIALILAHQHNGQLTYDVREALSANSANLSAFSLSGKDSSTVEDRFDEPDIRKDLSRQNVFNALTTISVDGRQSPVFTLQIERPAEQKDADMIARYIEAASRAFLVEPYGKTLRLQTKRLSNVCAPDT
jgi:hypothetical protein